MTRREPDLAAVRRALFSRTPRQRPAVPAAARKWALIEAAGPLEELRPSRRSLRRAAAAGARAPVARPIWVQRIGLSLEAARALVEATTLHGNVPEPLRMAHLIAGGIVTGKSRGRA